MRIRQILFLVLISILTCFEAKAQTASEVKQVEDYLNGIKNLQAKFVQTSSNGGIAEGLIYIAKPNKIRMEYDDPTAVLIVGDGDYIVYHDKELDQITHIDYDDIPASLILANNIKIDGKKIKVVDYFKDAGSTQITLDYSEKGDIGPISLVFNNNPFALKQWKIVDPQGIEIVVSLYNPQKDGEIDESIFKFKKKNPLNYKGKK